MIILLKDYSIELKEEKAYAINKNTLGFLSPIFKNLEGKELNILDLDIFFSIPEKKFIFKELSSGKEVKRPIDNEEILKKIENIHIQEMQKVKEFCTACKNGDIFFVIEKDEISQIYYKFNNVEKEMNFQPYYINLLIYYITKKFDKINQDLDFFNLLNVIKRVALSQYGEKEVLKVALKNLEDPINLRFKKSA